MKTNSLFENVNSGTFCQTHGDVVSRLPESCEIIAESDTGIQGFQYEGRNVFGVQFHPDFNYEKAKEVFGRRSAKIPSLRNPTEIKLPEKILTEMV